MHAAFIIYWNFYRLCEEKELLRYNLDLWSMILYNTLCHQNHTIRMYAVQWSTKGE